jgi:hypothetical protein
MSESINKNNSMLCVGLDVGTMFLQCARSDSDKIKTTRNVFLPLKEDEISISELNNISYIKGDDNIYIIGDDAFRLSNIFGSKLSRPMEHGLISQKEIDAIDVLTLMIKDLIGNVKDKDVYCSYSIPAEPIDEDRNVTYHEKVFARILGSLGINYCSVNESMAIIYNECKQEKYTGLAISFGAGMSNICFAFRGIEVFKFSTVKGGDYIDKESANSLGIVSNRVTSIKEKNLDLVNGFINEPNKKVKRVLEAIVYYYNNLISYTIKKIIEEFNNKVDIEIDEKVPIVISGGTSLPNGFLELFKDSILKQNLPFEISEIRRASNPLTSVASGLLIKTIIDTKK